MLVLERKDGESISVFVEGREIKVTLVKSGNGRTKLGITAPEDALILREEVLCAPVESFGFSRSSVI